MRKALVGGLGVLLVTAVHAAVPSGAVVSADRPWRVAASGQARAQPLLQGENAFVGRLVLEPGAKVPEHADPTEEYLVFVEGGGTMWLDGVEHAVAKGDAVYMPAHAKVSFHNGDARTEVVQVFAGPAPAAKYDAWAPAE